VNDLALKVGLVYRVVIDQADSTHTRCTQIERQRAAQAARADQQDAGSLQTALPFQAKFRHDQVATIAPDFVIRELSLFFNHWLHCLDPYSSSVCV
jgi:hypothetical protein